MESVKHTADVVMKEFRSVNKNIKEEELAEIAGKSKAEIIYNYFNG